MYPVKLNMKAIQRVALPNFEPNAIKVVPFMVSFSQSVKGSQPSQLSECDSHYEVRRYGQKKKYDMGTTHHAITFYRKDKSSVSTSIASLYLVLYLFLGFISVMLGIIASYPFTNCYQKWSTLTLYLRTNL
ncbi:hypothetical protein VNO77_00299 [Canavalia gladiata]|uniref:Uncharacterized protein n=1 Tax=Canavalia gladiata TaxID=3824 RepID=A0AAN9MUE2_CANGL